MSGKKNWRRAGRSRAKLHFWEKCLVFDLFCVCLAAGAVMSGVGKAKLLDQGVMPAAQVQEDTQAEKKKVALTFDDGPHPQYTPEMLAILKEHDVKATFFLLGEEVEKYPEVVKEIQEEGHVIGNHSYKHEQLSKLTMEQACAQVNRTNKLIFDITGVYPSYLRPPFGDWHEKLDCEVNMVEVLWDVDTLDWSSQNHAGIVNKVLKNVQENDIILMHDGYETSVTAAGEIIETLEKQGYEFVTVDEILFD
ncbi:MAG: polysaccharide deacetylase family protein [Lachnospiraceae bacterium]|nr:polysaccharide deacetylase family protein [Lachnospiraceae bacterium]